MTAVERVLRAVAVAQTVKRARVVTASRLIKILDEIRGAASICPDCFGGPGDCACPAVRR